MMQMTFYNSIHVTLWLESIRSSTWEGYLCLIVLVGWFGFLHEGLYAFRLACMTARSQAMNDECVSIHATFGMCRSCIFATAVHDLVPHMWAHKVDPTRKKNRMKLRPQECGFPYCLKLHRCWISLLIRMIL